MNITTSIIIHAPVAEVKKVFFDFEGHKTWNPFFKSISVASDHKEPVVGSQLHVILKTQSGKEESFKPYVLENSDNKFQWKGTLLFDFIASGTHTFQFIPETVNGAAATKVVQSEDFHGFLFSFFKSILVDTEKSFISLNQALKKKIES